MSDSVKRKGPPTKADLIERAVTMGIGKADDFEHNTASEIRMAINLHGHEAKPQVKKEAPPCEHVYTHQVREIHYGGNIVYKICEKCGHKQRVGG